MTRSCSVRVDKHTHEILKVVKETRGIEMQFAIKEAVEEYWGNRTTRLKIEGRIRNLGGLKNGKRKRDTRKV